LVVVAIYVATSGALILFLDYGGEACSAGVHGRWVACDQIDHLGLINDLIEHPSSVVDYGNPGLIATLPGFHLLVALVARLLGHEALGPDTWLRLVPFGFGLGVAWILWRIYRDLSSDPSYAALLCLPILWSHYFYLSSLFLVTDSAAYLGYVFLLLAYLRFPRRGLAIGLAATAMVSARQIFLPVIATHFFALARGVRPRSLDRGCVLAVLLGVLPPIAVVLVWVLAWQGLVPPEVRSFHEGRSFVELGPIVQAAGLTGVLAIPYGFLAYPALLGLERRRVVTIVAVASAAAVALWLLTPTTRDLDAGRWGSFVWLLARVSPAIGERALLVLPALLVGFVAAGLMIELARVRHYLPIELIMFALYAAALSMQLLSFQRYSEVVTLITLSATAARLGPPPGLGAVAFAAAFATKLVLTIVMPQAG
jgi:hypothetical protein